jgi:uncharacterized protein YraI
LTKNNDNSHFLSDLFKVRKIFTGVTLFHLFILLGSCWYCYNFYNNHGWSYQETTIIDTIEVTNTVYLKTYLHTVGIELFVFAASIFGVYRLDQIADKVKKEYFTEF